MKTNRPAPCSFSLCPELFPETLTVINPVVTDTQVGLEVGLTSTQLNDLTLIARPNFKKTN